MEELEDATKPLAEPIDSCGPAVTNLGLEVLSSFRTSVEVARPPVASFTEAAGLDVDKAVGIVPVDTEPGEPVSGNPSSPSNASSSAVGPTRSSLETSKDNKDIKFDQARYNFFDKMKAKKLAAKIAKDNAIVKPALPTMVEFACHPESNVGKAAVEQQIDSIRLSKENTDLLTKVGFVKAMDLVDRAVPPVHLHGSLPCTPWSRWQSFNIHKCGVEFSKQLAIDRTNSIQMLDHFYKLAKRVVAKGGTISFEWPRFCAGWDLPLLQQLISEFNLIQADVDGCSVGLRSVVTQNPIKKPWRFYCTQEKLAKLLSDKRCPGNHAHTICSGRDTVLSGFYPMELARLMIKGIFDSSRTHACVFNPVITHSEVIDLDNKITKPEGGIPKDLLGEIHEMISELGLSVSVASSLLAVSDAPATRIIPSMEFKVTELRL